MINKDKRKTHGFYLSLDDLFDTRLATLERMDEEKANGLLTTGYYKRHRDDFPGFDVNDFRRYYKERDKVTLAISRLTSLALHLSSLIGGYIVDNAAENRYAGYEIFLNIYPYQLTEEEINEFVLCLKVITGNIAPVRVLNARPEEITPEWLDDNIVYFYCYDWNHWMSLHSKECLQRRLDGVMMISPAILPTSLAEAQAVNQMFVGSEDYKKTITEEDLRDMKGMTVFDAITSLLRTTSINFAFMPAVEFSLAIPDEMPLPEAKFYEDDTIVI